MLEHGERQPGDDREDARRRAPGSRRSRSWRDATVDWCRCKIHFLSLWTRPVSRVELLLSVDRDGPRTLGAQIEEQLRARDPRRRAAAGRARAVDARPRAPARRLAPRRGRRVRAARGRGLARRCARARARACPTRAADAEAADAGAAPRGAARRASTSARARPTSSHVPARGVAARRCATRSAAMTDADLGYGDPRGVDGAARRRSPSYLGRVRGVVADPERVVVTCGYSQGLGARSAARSPARGARADRARGPEQPRAAARSSRRAGLEPVPVAVDERRHPRRRARRARRRRGRRSRPPTSTRPASCSPASAGTALLAWLRERDAVAIEDDYDAEYRYDRAAVGALQGLDARAGRLRRLGEQDARARAAARLARRARARCRAGRATRSSSPTAAPARIEQHAFADFLARGELDRHLRRMRARYRARRDALVAALAEELPEATRARASPPGCT